MSDDTANKIDWSEWGCGCAVVAAFLAVFVPLVIALWKWALS